MQKQVTQKERDSRAVVSRAEWLGARRALLAKEKQMSRLGDQLAEERRALPWVRLEKSYVFETVDGPRTLGELFGGRSQLVIYHFMFGPGWKEGCPGCSFLADHIDGPRQHLEHHDVSVVVVSRAPLAELLPFQRRMGWTFPWVSSFGSDFNTDFGVSFTKESIAAGATEYNYAARASQMEGEAPGASVFYRDEDGSVYHTYSSYARGLDGLLGAHSFLDLTPKGRNESGTMDWVRHHDKYE